MIQRQKRTFVLFCLFFSIFEVGFSQNDLIRTVNLKVVADADYVQYQDWFIDIKSLISDSSRKFEDYFGIHLNIKKIHFWSPNQGRESLSELFADLMRKVAKGDCDVVIGFTSREFREDNYYGLASYDQGYILIRNLRPIYLTKFTFEHELCHIFGALDSSWEDTITVMNGKNLGRDSNFDRMTSELVLLNKFRNFEINLSPISKRNVNDAIRIYNRIKKLNQFEADINMLLASLYLEIGDYDTAIKECRLARKIDPNYPRLHDVMGRAYLFKGENEKAIKELKSACKKKSNNYQAHSNLASTYLKTGRIDNAIEECNNAIAINPNYADAYSCLAYAFHKKEKLGDAEAACLKTISLNPHLPEPHNLLGIIFEKDERITEARQEFLKALELKPDYFEVHINLGIMYFKRNLLTESAYHFKKAMEINPDFAEAYSSLAVISFLQKDYALAQKYMDKAEDLGVEISPDFKRDLLRELKEN